MEFAKAFMRITKLHIENFRGFRGKHEIEFSDSNIHAVVGVNGAGKTSVLDALAIVLYDISNRNTGNASLKEYDIALGNRADINIHSKEALLVCTIKKYDEVRIKYSISENHLMVKTKILDTFNKEISSETLPILTYYRSGRNFHIDYKYDDYMRMTGSPDRAYDNIIESTNNFSELFLWYLKQIISVKNPEEIKRIYPYHEISDVSFITNAIDKFINKLRGTSLANIVAKNNRYNGNPILVINKHNEQIEFNQLSGGEKMVIGMVLDIAYRMSIANPHSENPLVSEGIVLIDELEQHLHPKWQMSILKALTATFPNVQFIVTTHSPLVINQLENHQLSILDDFKIIPGKEVHKVYGRDVNAIIEDFMGASHRPLDVKVLMNDIEKLLDDEHPNTERARKKLNELKAIIDPNDYEVIKLETQIVMEEDEVH